MNLLCAESSRVHFVVTVMITQVLAEMIVIVQVRTYGCFLTLNEQQVSSPTPWSYHFYYYCDEVKLLCQLV